MDCWWVLSPSQWHRQPDAFNSNKKSSLWSCLRKVWRYFICNLYNFNYFPVLISLTTMRSKNTTKKEHFICLDKNVSSRAVRCSYFTKYVRKVSVSHSFPDNFNKLVFGLSTIAAVAFSSSFRLMQQRSRWQAI